MSASKEIFCIMREEQFNAMQQDERESLIYVEFREANEYQNNKDDANYIKLKKAEKKAKNDLQTYLFNKRNK
jgi:predicted RND superfamily exporter protein